MLHSHLDERTMGYMVEARRDEIADVMAASQRRSWLATSVGRMLIVLGEKLRHDCPTPDEIMALHRRSRPQPSLT